MKKIETKDDVLGFLTAYIDYHTCSQGKGEIEKLPTGGCGDPHYLSRDQLFDLLGRIKKDEVTEGELTDWEFH